MFNTNVYKHESKVVAVTKEIEKTITPDKVTEMYDKVRLQAEKDVVASLRVNGNLINGVVVQIADCLSDMTSRIYTRFTLNGHEHIDSHTIDVREALSDGQLYQRLADHYLSVLRDDLLKKDIGPAFANAFLGPKG